MANTTFNGPVRSEKGFQQVNKNTSTGAYTARTLGLKPDLTSLTATVVGTGAALTYTKNVITVNDYTGVAAQTVTLPAANQGDIVVHAQSVDTTGGTGALVIDAAGSDVWATGSIIPSTSSSVLIMDTSTASETKLTYTPANATTNILTIGCSLYFVCFETGTWVISYDLARDPLAVTGTFAWS